MEMLSGRDERIVSLRVAAECVGSEEIKLLFGREVYSAIFSAHAMTQNSIYAFQPRRTRSLPPWFRREMEQRGKLGAIDAFNTLRGGMLPKLVANFRIVLSAEEEGCLVLQNHDGQTSPSLPTNYFDVRSGIGLRSRCSRQGEYYWLGSDRLVRPFIDYCLQEVGMGGSTLPDSLPL